MLTVTLGSLADLTSADGFSVCDTLRWSYDIFKLSFSFAVHTYKWVDSIYDTLFKSEHPYLKWRAARDARAEKVGGDR